VRAIRETVARIIECVLDLTALGGTALQRNKAAALTARSRLIGVSLQHDEPRLVGRSTRSRCAAGMRLGAS
jgi:hypothetical protein